MADISDFKRGQMVGVRMTGATLIKTAELFVASSTALKVRAAFEEEGQTSSLKEKPKALWKGPSDSYKNC